jgi:HB1, ASXL, restriction endonuclease HTH domain
MKTQKSTPKTTEPKQPATPASKAQREAAVAAARAKDAKANAGQTIGALAKKFEAKALGKGKTKAPAPSDMTEEDRKAAAELDARDRAEDAAAKEAARATSAPATTTEASTKPAKTAKTGDPRKLSGLDAAHKVLVEAKEPLQATTIVERMIVQGLWSTTGKTPAATIYAAIIREIAAKGAASRFKKTDRGLFMASAQ